MPTFPFLWIMALWHGCGGFLFRWQQSWYCTVSGLDSGSQVWEIRILAMYTSFSVTWIKPFSLIFTEFLCVCVKWGLHFLCVTVTVQGCRGRYYLSADHHNWYTVSVHHWCLHQQMTSLKYCYRTLVKFVFLLSQGRWVRILAYTKPGKSLNNASVNRGYLLNQDEISGRIKVPEAGDIATAQKLSNCKLQQSTEFDTFSHCLKVCILPFLTFVGESAVLGKLILTLAMCL